jgi:hypothetical protein
MKDRSFEDPDRPADIEKEREFLMGQNPLVVLDHLRAELKSLKTFKDEYEYDLKADNPRKKTALEVQNDQLQEKLSQMVTRYVLR